LQSFLDSEERWGNVFIAGMKADVNGERQTPSEGLSRIHRSHYIAGAVTNELDFADLMTKIRDLNLFPEFGVEVAVQDHIGRKAVGGIDTN